jgi:4-amino-4-deoxy-L-arabinose transferase-like glycosyltransferase
LHGATGQPCPAPIHAVVEWRAVMSAPRILRALTFAALAALVFHTHVFVAFRPNRTKVIRAPVAAAGGVVRVTAAGFPQLKELRPPFALIARIRMPAGGVARFTVAVDGAPVCERDVRSGAARRVDCVVATAWNPDTDHDVAVRGPAEPWTLEYLELATHHGNTSGAHTLVVLPWNSSHYDRPAWAWTLVLWVAVAGLLLLPAARVPARGLRLACGTIMAAIIFVLALSQFSERISNYRVVVAAGTFLMWLALLLAPWLWTGGRRLTQRAEGTGQRPLAAVRARAAAFFDAHPEWRPGGVSRRKALGLAALALVIGFFCVPLFVNLGEPEARSDEPIYFYAVERILETGDWLTPRLIPYDRPFLEKPPLKFWLVAGGVRAGLLSRDEAGMRWFDALFGAVGFIYVFFLGRRMGGSISGLAAVLVLFTLDPLIFDHGLRSHNMEAPLFLCYCGGVYHFARWVEAGARRARGQALAVAGYFVLGFMTKFVAALFLPVVCAVALVWRPDAWVRVRSGWRDWVIPTVATVAIVAPWFVYEAVREGAGFWRVIIGTHVYQRFTAVLDPGHLQPWNYYFVRTWNELRSSGAHWLALAGIVRLTVAAVSGESWLARLMLVWGLLPMVLISFGTSKLVHYLYPFWPVVGLAAGCLVGDILRAVEGPWGVGLSARLRLLAPRHAVAWCARDRWHRTVLLGIASAAGAAALLATLPGPSTVTIGGATFSSHSVFLPLSVAAVALFAGGYARAIVLVVPILGLLALSSVHVYGDRLARVASVDHPIRAVRDCMVAVRQAGVKTGSGVLSVERDLPNHVYYYYFWRVGTWDMRQTFALEETERRLWTPGEQTPVLISRDDYQTLVRRAGLWDAVYPAAGGPQTVPIDPVVDAMRNPLRSGARFNEELAILLPGPFQACLPGVGGAAGPPLWKDPAPAPHR